MAIYLISPFILNYSLTITGFRLLIIIYLEFDFILNRLLIYKDIRGTAGLNNNVMVQVRSKVMCHEIVICEGYDSKTGKMVEARRFKMQIVHGSSEENKLFASISGGTAVELQTINPLVFDMFKVKGEYYVDFIPVPPVVVEEDQAIKEVAV